MTARYYKATDGGRTYFRSTQSRAYRSLTISPAGTIGFSGLEPSQLAGRQNSGAYPAVEITKAEYTALVKAKAARIERVKAEVAARDDRTAEFWRERNFRGFCDSPQDSWIFNSELEEAGR